MLRRKSKRSDSSPDPAVSSELKLYELIACRAYELYEMRGSGPGDELSDWLAAEREVLAQLSTARGEAAESAVTTRSAIAAKTLDQFSKSDANGTSRRKTGPPRRRSPTKPGDAHP